MAQQPTRYQLRIGGTADRHIKEMCEKLGNDPKNVILEALAVYYCAIAAVERGKHFGEYDPEEKNFTALLTPALQELRTRQGSTSKSTAAKRTR